MIRTIISLWTTPLILAIALSSPLRTAIARENPRPPQATLSATESDLGEVLKGTAGHFEFLVRNTGDATLEIAVKSTCGCTVAKFDRVIAPGGQGKIAAVLDTTGMSGRVRKPLNVITNDPEKPSLPLMLAATVVEPVDIDRASLRLLQLSADVPTSVTIPVRVDPSEPTRITGVTCEQPYALAVVEPLPPMPSGARRYQVRVTVSPEAPLGRTTVAVLLATDSPTQPQVAVTLNCEKGIVVGAREIYFGIVRETTPLPLVRNVMIYRKGAPFQITNATSRDPLVEVEAVPNTGDGYRLVARYRGGAAEGLSKSTLRIETDDPLQPVLEIPLSYRVASTPKAALRPALP
jgi:hypothetical protein